MNTLDIADIRDELFSIEELESRFEMATVPPPSDGIVHTNWSCTLTFNSK